MAEDWAAVAADVAAGVADAGFSATLQPQDENIGDEWYPSYRTPDPVTITVVDQEIRKRDATGTLTGETMRELLVATGAVVPAKGDRVRVRGQWHEVANVLTVAPGGVDLLYRLEIED